MNLLLIYKFLLVIFFRKVSFGFIMIFTSCSPLLYMLAVDVGGVRMMLFWCDFKTFSLCVHHCQISVNDFVCILCVYLVVPSSCRISSAEDWEKSSSRSEPQGLLADMVMTSSGWCDTSIHSGLMWGLLVVLEWASTRNM